MGKVQQRAGGGTVQLKRVKIFSLSTNTTSSTTVDVKPVLPKVWDKLTSDNFATTSAQIRTYWADKKYNGNIYMDLTCTYNQDTGILTIPPSVYIIRSDGYVETRMMAWNVYCYYVE